MRLIKIEAEKSGGHFYQTIDHMQEIPEGWAVVPDDMETPNLPYGDIEVEEINGVMIVTSWTPREMPEPTEPPECGPSAEEILDTMLGVTI